jgi:DNA polymerase III subunit beta
VHEKEERRATKPVRAARRGYGRGDGQDPAMKFQVERDVLAEAVGWASRALPARPVIPVLSGLLLQAADDGLTLSCFDYEVSARVEVDAEIAEPGTVLVPGRLLAEITRSLPSLPVEFADDPEGVSLTCGSASFTLVTLPVEEYPDLPELPYTAGTVDGGVLAAAISQVTPAASRDDTLPLLTGVNIEVDGETMTLAATDRYRLAVRELPWEPAQPGHKGEYLVPARTLADAARTMAPGTPVTIRLRSGGISSTVPRSVQNLPNGRDADADAPANGPASRGPGAAPRGADAMIGFEAGGRRLTTRLIAGEYIKYRSRFPADLACRADMSAGPFTEAVRRVSLVAERGSAVRLSFGAGQVTIEAETQGRARARETVRAEFEGPEPVIAFSPHFLLDGIIAAGTPAALRPDDPDGDSARETAAQQAGAAAGRSAAAEPPPGITAARPAAGQSATDQKATGRKTAGRKAGSRSAAGEEAPAAASAGSASSGSASSGSASAGSASSGSASSGSASAGSASSGSASSGPLGPEPAADALASISIRLEFTSPTRPAVITGGSPGQGTPDFRYLVVPLRTAARQ